MAFGNNGLIKQSELAKELTSNSVEYEKQATANLTSYMGELIGNDEEKNENEDDDSYAPEDFVTEWTVNAGQTFALPIEIHTDNDFTVDWGDGSSTEQIVGEQTALPTHVYEKAGTYRLKINGTCPYFYLYVLEDNYPEQLLQLTKLVNWGEIQAVKYEFSDAENLTGAIPNPQPETFLKFHNDMSYMFTNTKITSIPENLFENVPDTVVEFIDTFNGCIQLASIPENLFSNCTNVTSFEGAFANCINITNIPDNLFTTCTNVTNFQDTFYGCEMLTEIPATLFSNCINSEEFESTFESCTKLTNIPENLFSNCTQATSFKRTFLYCENITAIPANLFANCTEVTSFEATFKGCEAVTQIPADLFKNCTKVTTFGETFNYVKMTSIPENLFATCTEATNFFETFMGCTQLQTIPTNLFINNTKATTFESTFEACNEVVSAPTTLFDTCTSATNYRYTFYSCNNITTGPKLWNKTTPTGIDGTGRYGDCPELTMTDTPELWKQIRPETV